jgi:hypothetical protein
MKSLQAKKIIWIILFSIAMAYLESAVVIYLREIYYPDGFIFPLTPIEKTIAITEFWREIATLIMLLGIGILTGKSSAQRFAFFLLSFAIWDIFYYFFLYILLGWPSSLMTWDILFLVPVPWVGPVLSPIIVSILMIILASSLIYFNKKINALEWLSSILGSIVIIISWVLDYWKFSTKKATNEVWIFSSKHNLFDTSEQYIPSSFNWSIFIVGVFLIAVTILSFNIRNNKFHTS